jgi:hypothetical protein
MRIADEFSYKGARPTLDKHFSAELAEINEILAGVQEKGHRSEDGSRLMVGLLKKTFKQRFHDRGWDRQRVKVEMLQAPRRPVYRDIDFVKSRLAAEVQLGRVALMGYSLAAKFPIFHDADLIDYAIQIVAMKELTQEMSSATQYFEQFVWDLQRRGTADVDIPVLILGVTL